MGSLVNTNGKYSFFKKRKLYICYSVAQLDWYYLSRQGSAYWTWRQRVRLCISESEKCGFLKLWKKRMFCMSLVLLYNLWYPWMFYVNMQAPEVNEYCLMLSFKLCILWVMSAWSTCKDSYISTDSNSIILVCQTDDIFL